MKITDKRIVITLIDRLDHSHELVAEEGILLSYFLKKNYIPRDAVIAKVNGAIVDDENYVISKNDVVTLAMVRAYQLPEYCKMLKLWGEGVATAQGNLGSIYTKNMLWFNANGVCEYKSVSMNRAEFIDWLDKNFVEGVLTKNLIKEGSKICLALSGGRDSLALLYLLERNRHRLPKFDLIGVTVAETAASKEDVRVAKEAIENFGLTDYTILPLEYVNETMNFKNGFDVAIHTTLTQSGRGRSIVSWHSVMRANVERFARERKISTIAFGYQHEDLFASIFRCNTVGGLFGESASKFTWGEHQIIAPLWTITKKELTLYLELVAPKHHTQQGSPTNFDRGDHNRDINYFVADLLSSVYPGVGFSFFQSMEHFVTNYSPKLPNFYHCKNCGITYNDRFLEGKFVNSKYCDTCVYFQEQGEIEKFRLVVNNQD